jgi:hypothetical protein
VLVQSHDFSDLPTSVPFPVPSELPSDTKPWLTKTAVVQVDNPLLRLTARQIRGTTTDLLTYAEHVASFIKNHRYWLFVLQLNFDIFFSQDALTTLFINGDNVGRSHLASALFRSQNIPARTILAHNDQGFWTQMHYMVEYYVPGYGWVLLDSTKGETPYPTQRQIINRICYPSDENQTKNDYIFRYMKGEERWLWIDNPSVHPYYFDCVNGSRSQMFDEGSTTVNASTGENATLLTKTIFSLYQHYLGMNLNGENQQHFTNASAYQYAALQLFKNTQNLSNYIQTLQEAKNEYQKIHL